jgi:photosystem II stability/assembly factor-like uncharacterized protein
LLSSLEHDIPRYDDSQLDAMLSEARKRSTRIGRRRRRQRWSIAGTVALAVAVLVAATSVGSLGNDGGAPARVVAAPAWKTVSDISQPSWQVLSSDGYQPGVGLTCPSAATCYLEDFSSSPGQGLQIEATRDGGTSWQQLSVPGDIGWLGRGLSCLDGESCFALGQDTAGVDVIVRTSDGGASWSTQQLSSVPSSANLSEMSCSSLSSCVVVGASYDLSTSFALVTADAGKSWTRSALPDGFVPLRVACGADAPCLVSGYWRQSFEGGVLYSTDGGSTWTAARLPAGTAAVTSISCGDSSHCLATTMGDESSSISSTSGPSGPTAAPVLRLQSSVLATTDGGLTWQATAGGVAPSLLTSLSCVTPSYCWTSGVEASPAPGGQSAKSSSGAILVLSGNGYLASTEDAGASWQSAQLPSDVDAVAGVACPDATNCYAVGFAAPGGAASGTSGPSGPTGASSGGRTSGPDGHTPGSFVFLQFEPGSP